MKHDSFAARLLGMQQENARLTASNQALCDEGRKVIGQNKLLTDELTALRVGMHQLAAQNRDQPSAS